MEGNRGTTGPIRRSGLSVWDAFNSIAGNGDIDQSELELELPGDRSLYKKKYPYLAYLWLNIFECNARFYPFG